MHSHRSDLKPKFRGETALQATIYRIDQVLLPPATLTNLGRTSTSDSDNGEDAEGEAEGDRK